MACVERRKVRVPLFLQGARARGLATILTFCNFVFVLLYCCGVIDAAIFVQITTRKNRKRTSGVALARAPHRGRPYIFDFCFVFFCVCSLVL